MTRRMVLAAVAALFLAACPALGWRQVDVRIVGADGGLLDGGDAGDAP